MLQSLNGMKGMHIYNKTKYSKCATSIAQKQFCGFTLCACHASTCWFSRLLCVADLFALALCTPLVCSCSHKAAAWELRRRPCFSVRLWPVLPCNLNFYINGLSINYWGYIVRQLPCVTNGSVDGKCFLLCVWQTAGGLLGAACWLYAQLLFSLWPRWELKPSVRPSLSVKIACLL